MFYLLILEESNWLSNIMLTCLSTEFKYSIQIICGLLSYFFPIFIEILKSSLKFPHGNISGNLLFISVEIFSITTYLMALGGLWIPKPDLELWQISWSSYITKRIIYIPYKKNDPIRCILIQIYSHFERTILKIAKCMKESLNAKC